MSSSRCLIMFVLLALYLAPFRGWDRATAGQRIAPTPDPVPPSAPTQIIKPSVVSTTLVHPCHNTGGTNELIASASGWHSYLSLSAFSADGRFVISQWGDGGGTVDTNYPDSLYLHDRMGKEGGSIAVGLNGTGANGDSFYASISPDGHYIAYQSFASNLVISDTNGTWDVFFFDRLGAQTERVSVASDGSQANGSSFEPAISADGRFVAFSSEASNLVSDDTNGVKDIFLHDRLTGETRLISQAPDGSPADGASATPAISSDGRFVAYDSWASNLVSGDTNQTRDVFLYDRLSAETTLISVATDGSQGNDESGHVHLSADGRILIFMSRASNLAGIVSFPYWGLFVRDRLGGETWRAAAGVDDLNISADGRFAVSVTEPPNYSTIAVHDLQSGKTSYISAPPRRNFKHQLLISTFHLSRWAIRGVLYI